MSNITEYNSEVSTWTLDTKRKLKNRVLRLVLNIGPAYDNLQGNTKKYMGEANKIQFTFPYYMVFVHKGAGRGYGGGKTGLFSRADGSKGVTNPASFGRMGSSRRIAKPWFNPVILDQFPDLEEIILDYRGSKIVLQVQHLLID